MMMTLRALAVLLGYPSAELQAHIGSVREAIAAERALPDAELRRRPDDGTWSALEYACHVRDVFALYDHRLALMVTEEDPTYPNWDQDVTAVEDGYGPGLDGRTVFASVLEQVVSA